MRRCLVGPAVGRGLRRGLCSALPKEADKPRLMRARCIWADGRSERLESTGRDLAHSFGLLPRDLRLLTTHHANVAVRPACFMFRLPPFTGCVSSDRCVLIEDNGNALDTAYGQQLAPPILKLATKHLHDECVQAVRKESRRLAAGDVDGTAQPPRPFELLVLDTALRQDVLRKAELFARLSQQIERNLAVRDRHSPMETSRRSIGLLTLAADAVAEQREAALYRLFTLADSLGALSVEVRRGLSCLEGLLSSDERLGGLILSRTADPFAISEPQWCRAELEYTLEAYTTYLEDLDDRITALQASLSVHQNLESLKLRNERNRIARMEVLLSIGGISMVMATMISGFWGMNLHSGIETVPHAFWWVAGLSGATSALLLVGLVRGVTRFHRVHREMLVSCSSLKNALLQVDHASYALRRAGIEDRPAGIGGGVSRAELADAMDSSGMALRDEELDALMDLMDADRDGVLSNDEIRLFRVDPKMSGHA